MQYLRYCNGTIPFIWTAHFKLMVYIGTGTKKKKKKVTCTMGGYWSWLSQTLYTKRAVPLFQTDHWYGTNYLFDKGNGSTNSKLLIGGG
jgi:hypothetical protein